MLLVYRKEFLVGESSRSYYIQVLWLPILHENGAFAWPEGKFFGTAPCGTLELLTTETLIQSYLKCSSLPCVSVGCCGPRAMAPIYLPSSASNSISLSTLVFRILVELLCTHPVTCSGHPSRQSLVTGHSHRPRNQTTTVQGSLTRLKATLYSMEVL